MKKKILYLLMAACLTVSVFVGCGNTADTAGGATPNAPVVPDAVVDTPDADNAVSIDMKIGWAPPNMTGVFKTATDYMQAACDQAKAYGLNITLVTKPAESEADTAGQVKNIENLVQEGCDVIICSPSNTDAVKPALNEAKAAGVYTIMVNLLEELDGVDIDCYIGFDNYVAGQISAYAVLDQLGGPGVLGEGEKVEVADGTYLDLKWWENLYKDVDKASISGKVGVIEGVLGNYYSNLRKGGFQDVMAEYPNIEILDVLPGNWERQPSVTAAENILQAHNEVNAIWAAATEMAIGATIARDNMGRSEVLVFSNDGTPESLECIRQGTIIAETWHGFPEWGWYGVEAAVKLKLGQGDQVDKLIDCLPRTEYIGNADDFYPQPKLSPIDWKALIDNAK